MDHWMAVCSSTSVPIHKSGIRSFSLTICISVNFASTHSQHELHAWVFTMWSSFLLCVVCECVFVCMHAHVCMCVYQTAEFVLCFEGQGSQSVPLQINSLIPGSVFSPKHPLSPASASLSLLSAASSLSPVPALLLLYTLGLSLALCQSETYMGCCGFVWESDGSVAGGGVEMHPHFESIALVFKASLFR